MSTHNRAKPVIISRQRKREFIEEFGDAITLTCDWNATIEPGWKVDQREILSYYKGDTEIGTLNIETSSEAFGNASHAKLVTRAMFHDLYAHGKRQRIADFKKPTNFLINLSTRGYSQVVIEVIAKRNTLYKLATALIHDELTLSCVDEVLADLHVFATEFGNYDGYLKECGEKDTVANRRYWNRNMKRFGWIDDVIPLKGAPISEGERKHAEAEKKAEAAYKRKERIAKKNGWQLDWLGNYVKPAEVLP